MRRKGAEGSARINGGRRIQKWQRGENSEVTLTAMLMVQMLTIQIMLTTLVTIAVGDKPSEIQKSWDRCFLMCQHLVVLPNSSFILFQVFINFTLTVNLTNLFICISFSSPPHSLRQRHKGRSALSKKKGDKDKKDTNIYRRLSVGK